MWCSNCNRWTDERCLNCNLFQENENDICIGEQCEKCKLYMEKEDLCGLVFMPKEVKDGNQQSMGDCKIQGNGHAHLPGDPGNALLD